MYFSRLAFWQFSWQHLPKFEQLFLQALQQFGMETNNQIKMNITASPGNQLHPPVLSSLCHHPETEDKEDSNEEKHASHHVAVC